jgi:hypothetical protein
MAINVYSFLHVGSLLLLTAGVFYAFSAPAEARKRMLMLTGMASLVMLFGGLGLLARKYGNHFYPWVIVKLVCWLGLTGLTGIAFRRRDKTTLWVLLACVLLVVGVAMVYFQPGM